MQPDIIAPRIIQLAAEQAAMPLEQVSEQSHFLNDLSFDSLDMVEFTMALEEEYELSIKDEEAEKLQTVGAVIDYVTQQKQLAAAE